jgi:hypothetical protein
MEHWNMSEKSERVATNVTPGTKERIEAQLDYGDHISEWLRDAIEKKLDRDEGAEGNSKPAVVAAD